MSVQPEERDKPYGTVEEPDATETDAMGVTEPEATKPDTTDAMETDATEVMETEVRTTLPVTSNDSRAPPPLARR